MFEAANYVEAALWVMIAAALAITGVRVPHRRRLSCAAAIAFCAFGASDLVEARTGAWWRPWWLLVWKGLCIAVLLACLRSFRSAAVREPGDADQRRTK